MAEGAVPPVEAPPVEAALDAKTRKRREGGGKDTPKVVLGLEDSGVRASAGGESETRVFPAERESGGLGTRDVVSEPAERRGEPSPLVFQIPGPVVPASGLPDPGAGAAAAAAAAFRRVEKRGGAVSSDVEKRGEDGSFFCPSDGLGASAAPRSGVSSPSSSRSRAAFSGASSSASSRAGFSGGASSSLGSLGSTTSPHGASGSVSYHFVPSAQLRGASKSTALMLADARRAAEQSPADTRVDSPRLLSGLSTDSLGSPHSPHFSPHFSSRKMSPRAAQGSTRRFFASVGGEARSGDHPGSPRSPGIRHGGSSESPGSPTGFSALLRGSVLNGSVVAAEASESPGSPIGFSALLRGGIGEDVVVAAAASDSPSSAAVEWELEGNLVDAALFARLSSDSLLSTSGTSATSSTSELVKDAASSASSESSSVKSGWRRGSRRARTPAQYSEHSRKVGTPRKSGDCEGADYRRDEKREDEGENSVDEEEEALLEEMITDFLRGEDDESVGITRWAWAQAVSDARVAAWLTEHPPVQEFLGAFFGLGEKALDSGDSQRQSAFGENDLPRGSQSLRKRWGQCCFGVTMGGKKPARARPTMELSGPELLFKRDLIYFAAQKYISGRGFRVADSGTRKLGPDAPPDSHHGTSSAPELFPSVLRSPSVEAPREGTSGLPPGPSQGRLSSSRDDAGFPEGDVFREVERARLVLSDLTFVDEVLWPLLRQLTEVERRFCFGYFVGRLPVRPRAAPHLFVLAMSKAPFVYAAFVDVLFFIFCDVFREENLEGPQGETAHERETGEGKSSKERERRTRGSISSSEEEESSSSSEEGESSSSSLEASSWVSGRGAFKPGGFSSKLEKLRRVQSRKSGVSRGEGVSSSSLEESNSNEERAESRGESRVRRDKRNNDVSEAETTFSRASSSRGSLEESARSGRRRRRRVRPNSRASSRASKTSARKNAEQSRSKKSRERNSALSGQRRRQNARDVKPSLFVPLDFLKSISVWKLGVRLVVAVIGLFIFQSAVLQNRGRYALRVIPYERCNSCRNSLGSCCNSCGCGTFGRNSFCVNSRSFCSPESCAWFVKPMSVFSSDYLARHSVGRGMAEYAPLSEDEVIVVLHHTRRSARTSASSYGSQDSSPNERHPASRDDIERAASEIRERARKASQAKLWMSWCKVAVCVPVSAAAVYSGGLACIKGVAFLKGFLGVLEEDAEKPREDERGDSGVAFWTRRARRAREAGREEEKGVLVAARDFLVSVLFFFLVVTRDLQLIDI